MTDRQPEVDDRHDSLVVEGEDEGHVLPPPELDPYTPEPSSAGWPRGALYGALAAIVIVLVVLFVYAATR